MLRMQEIAFPGFKFQNFKKGSMSPDPPIHAWYVCHTRGLQPLLFPSNILYHIKVPVQKMPLPHGRIHKNGPVMSGENSNESVSQSVSHSFIHSLIRSFVHSFIRSFVHSFIHSVKHSNSQTVSQLYSVNIPGGEYDLCL